MWSNRKLRIELNLLYFVDLRQCRDDPCGDYGTCYEDGNSYYCTCNEGYVGTNCTEGMAIACWIFFLRNLNLNPNVQSILQKCVQNEYVCFETYLFRLSIIFVILSRNSVISVNVKKHYFVGKRKIHCNCNSIKTSLYKRMRA